tara:strand:- start:712 stop:1455 length:744 start_codon:yes stop_codon:yes gene_type:complete
LVETQLDAQLAGMEPGEQLTLQWPRCFNCETSQRIDAAAASELAALKKVAEEKLSQMPARAEREIVEVGVIASPDVFHVPLEAGSPGTYADFEGLRCAITLVPRSLNANLLKEEEQVVHAAALGPFAYQEKLFALDAAQAERCAGGDAFDTALTLLASDKLCAEVRALRATSAAGRLAACQALLHSAARSGDLTLLADVHFDKLTDTHDATRLVNEERCTVTAIDPDVDAASDDDGEHQATEQATSK